MWVLHIPPWACAPRCPGQSPSTPCSWGSGVRGLGLDSVPYCPLLQCVIDCAAFLKGRHSPDFICKCVTHLFAHDSTDGSLCYTRHGISRLCWKDRTFLHIFLNEPDGWIGMVWCWLEPLPWEAFVFLTVLRSSSPLIQLPLKCGWLACKPVFFGNLQLV